MSFGFGSGGGFGQNNNQQTQSTFGGFGAANTNTGFGSTPANTGFGAANTNAGGSIFGGAATATGGFGGFGANTNAGFGAKPAGFGAPAATTTAGGLFGASNTTTSGGFGGFGAAQAPATSGFGGSSGGSLFGANKPAFGGTAAPAFGAATNTGFGGASTTGAFGAPASTALGAGAGECQGTGSVPFQAFVEKEPNSNTNQQNSFQSISFQQPYQKFSPEELRLADYNQGRRFGNQNNQPGAFGTSNFSSFGNNQATTSGFGAANPATSTNMFGGGFGATSQPQSTGFGANPAAANTGGLFGAKPAGGLFGAATPAQPATGGLFGGSNTGFGGGTTGAFGANNTAPATTGLFGQNTTANKPAGFSFGSTAPAAGTGFGATPAATTTGFGGGGGLFGNNNAQQATTGFGAQPQQPAAATGFGGFGGAQQPAASGGLFGQAQQKPATSLFGQQPAAATGGLFGGAQQPAATGGLFGNSTNTQATPSLFGQKPAATGGLFGATNTAQTNTGGGLFGGSFGAQNQAQPQQTNSLFGGLGNNNNQQKPAGGLFGAQPQQQANTGGLFGGLGGNQQQQGGLFGGLNNNQQQQQQQPQNSLFGGNNSLFGGSQQNQQTPQSLTASINDPTAFGNAALFFNVQSTQANNPGPLATPLSGSTMKKAAALPIYKLNPASSSRFSTPAKRGFGFSYSTYGTPNSASSTTSTPGLLSSSMLGGSIGRGLSKSMSTSSLRRNFNSEDSILAPGAFSASPNARHFGSTGSIKKLVINRSLRGDLFSPPTQQPQSSTTNNGILKKRVSFDASATAETSNGTSSPLKQVHNNATPTSQELGYLRPPTSTNGAKANSANSAPEMEQVKNNELAIVHEEDASAQSTSRSQSNTSSVSAADQEPGEYWMSPTIAEIENMSHSQRKAVEGLTVGRDCVGQVTFNAPVDLNKVNIHEICGGIVVLAIRSCTVYPIAGKKPPRGQGLNVPSTISLMNSRPRSGSDKNGARMKKHIERLKRVPDTTFVDFDPNTGTWSFSVDHFTTYGLDYDDDETDVEGVSEFEQSTLSAPPDTPTPKSRTPNGPNFDESFASTSQVTESDPEDTFDFRKKRILPGAFDGQEAFEVDEEMEGEYDEQTQLSFLGDRSVGSQSSDGIDEPMQHAESEDWGSVNVEEHEMVGSFPIADNTTEQPYDSEDDDDIDMAETPGGMAVARLRARKDETPARRKFTAGNDWAATLRTTISPKKQDRALLKSLIDIYGNDSRLDKQPTPAPRPRVVSDGRGFATSIDLMNSLFNQAGSPAKKGAKITAQAKGFEWPYPKRPKPDDGETQLSDADRAFHNSMKPHWGPDGTLVYAAPANTKPFGRSSRRARARDGLLTVQNGGIVSEGRDVRFAKFSNEVSATALKKQIDITLIEERDGVPYASLSEDFNFADLIDEQVSDKVAENPAVAHENLVWQLASVLWDALDIPPTQHRVDDIDILFRKEKLSHFWEKLVNNSSSKDVIMARSHEEKAIASLSGHKIPDACGHLLNGKDFHLATMVAQIGGPESQRQQIREQLGDWQRNNFLSEFSQPIRTLYELLAGNVCVCKGSKGTVEDRVESFIISKRFGLDWRQAFGLRLWYGIKPRDDIAEAVNLYANDFGQDREPAFPHAWYYEQKLPTLWDDPKAKQREDLLWGLLKLSAYQKTDLESIIRPENSQLSPLDIRLSWQLSRTLTTVPNITYQEDAEEKEDRATLSFASQLNNEGSWLEALFVLLHLTSAAARQKAIQDHLAHHAGRIGKEDSPEFVKLTHDFRVPADWIWEAKALYKRAVDRNPKEEVQCLLKANLFEEAHRTFVKEVAPTAIVERDYETLRALLSGFANKENSILDWRLGGEIYADFMALLDGKKRGSVEGELVQRLLGGVPAAMQESRFPGFLERVAMEIMSGVVAKAVVEMGKNGETQDLPKILSLPLSADGYLKHTVELSLEYYRAIVVAGR